jgi:pimeloyl-[acyl-carrier protein] methyl ester esterase
MSSWSFRWNSSNGARLGKTSRQKGRFQTPACADTEGGANALRRGAYRSQRETGMRLVMLPGLDGSGDLFRPLLQVLPTQLASQVIPYPADRVLSYNALVPFVQDAFPQREPFVLLGESFGGPLAIRCAATPPANLRAVILSATFATNPVPYHFRWLPWVSSILRFKPPDALIRYYAAGMDSGQDLVDLFQQARKKTCWQVLAARLQAVRKVDVRLALQNCWVPLLCLRAMRDRLVRRKCHLQMLSVRPDMKVIEINSPHFLLQRRPDEAAKAIMDFVYSLPLPG